MDKENELENLVKKIFEIIPSYYDEQEAEEIKKLINEYIEKNIIIPPL
jgi:hypothetical protein